MQLYVDTSCCSELWEKKPLLVKRHMPNYNDGWFSTAELDRVMREVMWTEVMSALSHSLHMTYVVISSKQPCLRISQECFMVVGL